MATWAEVEGEVPELAARAREFLDRFTHKTLATLRRDGSPRISGTEVEFREGELTLGSMLGAVKALDLRRDPRFALHSGSSDPPGWSGDAKVAGRLEEVTDRERFAALIGEEVPESLPYHLFRADVTEVVVVTLNEERDKLVIEAWHEGRGVSRMTR